MFKRIVLRYGCASVFAVLASSNLSLAQSLVVNGLYDCVRATNGRAYCKKQGAPAGNQYVPVSDDFLRTYEAAKNPAATEVQSNTINNNQTSNTVVNNLVVVGLASDMADLSGQVDLLKIVLSEQQKLLDAKQGSSDAVGESIVAIRDRIKELSEKRSKKAAELSKYPTPVHPDDSNLGITARKASEIYPKVPYYIPGTKEEGEFWIEPVVSNVGALTFSFKFVDAKSNAAEKVRSSIEMTPDELLKTRDALLKIASNSKMAHEKKIRRVFSTRITCFPDADCPPEGKKIDGKASTELIFSINEDGSTSGRIQRNKGKFEEGYNVSIPSGLLLQAYINHVLSEGKAEFEAGSATQEDLKNIFK